MAFEWPKGTSLNSPQTRKALRQAILESIYLAKSGHPGGSFSMVEILTAIFDKNFHYDLKDFAAVANDHFVLSKGHGVPAYYAVLSALGLFPAMEMAKLRHYGHFLQGHPDRLRFSAMEASTGSLGQGASVALGMALGLRLDFQNKKLNRLPKVYCVLGDGETQEGQVWECLMACGKFQPGNLIFILDYNKGQIDGTTKEVMDLEPLVDKLRAFNLDVQECDGHDVEKLSQYFNQIEAKPQAKTKFLVAHTIKGKGVSFIEHPNKWHGAAPNKEQLDQAIKELFPEGSPQGSLLTAL
ncbi:MAG: transketolase [Proteobacteria bacterium]|nr:transketolase [Pseudomonadota bacterium]